MGKSDFVFEYRIRNWPEYHRALVARVRLTFWVDEAAIEAWRDNRGSGPLGGRPRIYTDTAIECALVIKAVFHLSLRATQGFLESVIGLMGIELPVPDYTTVSRRQSGLALGLGPPHAGAARHVVIDSTGLKVGAAPHRPSRRGETPGAVRPRTHHHIGRRVTPCCGASRRRVGVPRPGRRAKVMAENAISRFKALVGVKLSARSLKNQRVEALVKCRALNRMLALGLPRSARIQPA